MWEKLRNWLGIGRKRTCGVVIGNSFHAYYDTNEQGKCYAGIYFIEPPVVIYSEYYDTIEEVEEWIHKTVYDKLPRNL